MGQVRLDCNENSAEINIAILPDYRGRGYAVFAIKESCVMIFDEFPGLDVVFAHIQENNMASQKSFFGAGFKSRGNTLYKNNKCVEFALTREDLKRGLSKGF